MENFELKQGRTWALQNNPQIVSLTTAERWDGKLPQTMLPGATVPFINAK